MPSYWRKGHSYYDEDGQPIQLMDWAKRKESALLNPAHFDRVTLPNGFDAELVTVYLGFVTPEIYDCRLYGTVLRYKEIRCQIQVYDTKDEARQRHHAHRQAIADGFHCAMCREQRPHDD